MYIADAKFEGHFFDAPGVIFDWVLFCLRGATYDVIAFVICMVQEDEYL